MKCVNIVPMNEAKPGVQNVAFKIASLHLSQLNHGSSVFNADV